ncbi:MAG TPA: 4Fe-4S dicluster domain-containing protein [Bacillota bacterium]|nr:4Fe-4S dicluster domain-containing protein [Bacillota bacterium]
MKRLSVQDRLALNKFQLDEEPHIAINKALCRQCAEKPCTFVCPAALYAWNGDDISFDHAGCLECGTCRVACTKKAVSWNYPRGAFGISFRYG